MDYNDLIGTPFQFNGRSKSGLDCWGLVIEFYRRLNIAVEDPLKYDEEIADNDDVFEYLRQKEEDRKREWREIPPPYRFGDICFFSYTKEKTAQHVAIWLPGNRLIHSLQKLGVVISPFRHFQQKFIRAWRNQWLG